MLWTPVRVFWKLPETAWPADWNPRLTARPASFRPWPIGPCWARATQLQAVRAVAGKLAPLGPAPRLREPSADRPQGGGQSRVGAGIVGIRRGGRRLRATRGILRSGVDLKKACRMKNHQ